jgi:hypothetical protein
MDGVEGIQEMASGALAPGQAGDQDIISGAIVENRKIKGQELAPSCKEVKSV